jgi:peptidyl-prolyl cis-trans isomerase B (cyclophilin B)
MAGATGTGEGGIILAPVLRSPLATLVTAALTLAAAAGCGGDASDDGGGGAASSSTGQDRTTTAAGSLPAGCRRVAQPRPRAEGNVPRPRGRLEGPASVEMQTNCGTFTIRLATGRAPRTTNSFATLVERGFYDRLTFHRIAGSGDQSFVIQGGDPLGTGTGGPGFSVVERPPSDLRYTRYTVAMAKTAAEPAGTSGSQFFVVTAADAGLPPEYAFVGRVTGGTEVVDRIASVPTGSDERPVAPVVISKATLRES